jgi:putative DNA primase/helicase
MITKRGGVVYDKDATCPYWLTFQNLIADKHEGLVEYKQKAFATLLSGLIAELLFIAHGVGANGKTTELDEILSRILGDYACAADAALLTNRKEAGGTTPELCALMGMRAVFVNETGEKDWLNESRVKYITAKDMMYGNPKYKDPINWKPTHKPVLRTNHRPKIRETDEGMWQRVQYVPYTYIIPKDDRDINFSKKYLLSELSRILNWLIRGWLKYQADGMRLNAPKCVLEGTQDYKEESDITGRWVKTRLVKAAPGVRLSLEDAHY